MRESPRTQPAKPPLSKEAVLDAGLSVLRAKGIDGVTMLAVAAEHDTGPASLYVYVANRQDLLDEMFDQVASQIDFGDVPNAERSREQLVTVLTRTPAVLEQHDGITRVPHANVPTRSN